MSDLMGRKLLPAATPQVPYSLHEFVDEEELRKPTCTCSRPFSSAASSLASKNDGGTSTLPSPAEQSTGPSPVTSREPARSVKISARCRDSDAAASGYRRAPSARWIAGGFVARPGIGSADLVGEPVAGGLPGYAERNRDPVPAPPAGPRRSDPLGDQGLVAADLLRGLGNRPQV
jgi:hypothetical protein